MYKFTQSLSAALDGAGSIIHQYSLNETNRPLRLRMTLDQTAIDHALLIKQANLNWKVNDSLCMQVICLSMSAHLPLKELIGLPIALEQVTDKGQLFGIHGVVTAAEIGESDGALACYQLIIEDSLSLLKKRRNSRIFVDQTILDITNALWQEWLNQSSTFANSIELNFTQISKEYPPLSFTMQHQESDYDFLTRLWRKYGLNWWIEPIDAIRNFMPGASPIISTPKHSLILCDSNTLIKSSNPGSIRYHRNSATEPRDTITSWIDREQLSANSTTSQHWVPAIGSIAQNNHLSLNRDKLFNTTAQFLEDHHLYSPQHPEDQSQLAQLDQVRMHRHTMKRNYIEAVSHVRDLQPGRYFTLKDHPTLDSDSNDHMNFVVLAMNIVAENNLPKQLNSQSNQLLLKSRIEFRGKEKNSDFEALQLKDSDTYRYKNQFIAVRRSVSIVADYDPLQHDPIMRPMIATVVGEEGEEIYCDARYRVQINFPHMREQDHFHQGGRGASKKAGDSAWVPVLAALAGDQFGQSFLPRVGETVVVDFLNGDPDRPFISGRLYDGVHTPAQFSHTGKLPENRHISGIVTKEIHGSRTNQLRFDDTQHEISTQLHSDEESTQLNLGFLTHPRNEIAQQRGQGFELRTDAQGAIRAQGLYISSHGQQQAKGEQMDAGEAKQQLSTNLNQMKALNAIAINQNAEPLNVLENLQAFITNLENQPDEATKSRVTAFKEALMVLASPSGIALSAAKDIHLHAGENISQSSSKSINISSQENVSLNTGQTLSLFAARQGAKIYAGKGKIDIQAQNDALDLLAHQQIRIISTDNKIEVISPKEITLKAAGSEIRIDEGGVTISSPKLFCAKAGQHKFESGSKINIQIPVLPNLAPIFSNKVDCYNLFQWNDFKDIHYKIRHSENTYSEGQLDEHGRTERVSAVAQKSVQILVGHKSELWYSDTETFTRFDEEPLQSEQDSPDTNNSEEL